MQMQRERGSAAKAKRPVGLPKRGDRRRSGASPGRGDALRASVSPSRIHPRARELGQPVPFHARQPNNQRAKKARARAKCGRLQLPRTQTCGAGIPTTRWREARDPPAHTHARTQCREDVRPPRSATAARATTYRGAPPCPVLPWACRNPRGLSAHATRYRGACTRDGCHRSARSGGHTRIKRACGRSHGQSRVGSGTSCGMRRAGPADVRDTRHEPALRGAR